MKTWAKCVYMGWEFAVNNILIVFMAMNRDLRSLMPDRDRVIVTSLV